MGVAEKKRNRKGGRRKRFGAREKESEWKDRRRERER